MKTTALNIIKGFFACSLIGVVPIELYKFCISLQNTFSHDLARIFAGTQSLDLAGQSTSVLQGSFMVAATAEYKLFNLLAMIAFAYCMNKRITSLLLCFVMVFAMLATAVPALAAPITSTQLKVIPDKTTASPGETITYTIIMGPVSDMGSMQMVLDIPTGLTYVENSTTLAANLKTTLGFDLLDWTEVYRA